MDTNKVNTVEGKQYIVVRLGTEQYGIDIKYDSIILKNDDSEQILTKIKEIDKLKILFQNSEGAIVEKIN